MLRKALGLSSDPVMTATGSCGYDSIYKVSHDGRTLGVLRLINPWRERKNLWALEPFLPQKGTGRITREWQAYETGAPLGLTPKVIWRAEDALLCEYLPYSSLFDMMMERPEKTWDLLCLAAKRVDALHRAGETHMDVSLKNLLADNDLKHLVLIDFEYSPKAHVTPAQQRLYDHLRLVDSTWKFISNDLRKPDSRWLEILDTCLDDDMRQADITPIAPVLQNLLTNPTFRAELQKRLAPGPGWDFDPRLKEKKETIRY